MKKISLMVVILTLVAFITVASAQQTAPAKPAGTTAPPPAAAPAKAEKPVKMHSFSGDIMKVDAMAKMIMIKSKKGEMTFVADDKTKITMGGKAMPLGDLKEGMGANVSYKKDGDKNMAATIKLAAPKVPVTAKPKPATTNQ
jgi:hypothetical protein